MMSLISKSQYQTQPPVHNLHHEKEQSHTQSKVECYRCGGDHYATKCKFIDADCRLCGKKGHLARVCQSRKEKPQQQKNPPKAKTGHPPQPLTGNTQLTTWTTSHILFPWETLTKRTTHCLLCLLLENLLLFQ